jgi:hypothetical protein
VAVVLAGALLLAQVLVSSETAPGSDSEQVADAEVLVEVEAPVVPYVAPVGMWDRLARCESGGNWSAVSAGGRYRGGLQFDQQTWLGNGGGAYASSAHLASRTQQIAVAERLRAVRGMAPWPVCRWRI